MPMVCSESAQITAKFYLKDVIGGILSIRRKKCKNLEKNVLMTQRQNIALYWVIV